MYATRASFGYPVAFSCARLVAWAVVKRTCSTAHLPVAAGGVDLLL
jgi:hypothetical protein